MQHKLKNILAITLLMISMAFMPNSLWAQETLLEEETPLDKSATAPEGAPTDDAKYSGFPILNFYLSDDDFLIIKVDGLLIGDADGFSWSGNDITETVEQMQEAGNIEVTERDDGFEMLVKMPIQQIAGKNEFGVIYSGNNKLSSTVDSELLLAEAKPDGRAFGYLNVYGRIKEYGSCGWSWGCWKNARYATVYFWVKDAGIYRFVGAATTNSRGWYDVNIDGVCGAVYIQATNNGKFGEASSSVWSCGRSRTYVKINSRIR